MAPRTGLSPDAPASPGSLGCGEPTRECRAGVLVLLLASVLGLSLLLAGLTLRGVQSSSPCAGATFAWLRRGLRRCESSPNPSGGWLGLLPGERQDMSALLRRFFVAAMIMPWRMLTTDVVSRKSRQRQKLVIGTRVTTFQCKF